MNDEVTCPRCSHGAGLSFAALVIAALRTDGGRQLFGHFIHQHRNQWRNLGQTE